MDIKADSCLSSTLTGDDEATAIREGALCQGFAVSGHTSLKRIYANA